MAQRARRSIILAVVCFSMVVVTANIAFLNIGLPDLSKALGASNTALEWIVDGYALVFAGLLLAVGSLGDRIGAKRTLAIGLMVFTAAAAASALATSSTELIICRSLMGAGAAGITPMTLSIITHAYEDPHEMRKAIGVWAATAAAGSVIAPVAAGLLLSHFWWGILFWVNVPLGIVALVAVLIWVPSFPVRPMGRFDTIGALLSVLFSSCLVAALIEAPSRGWLNAWVLAGFGAAVIFLAAFILWERQTTDPLIDVQLFKIPQFSIGALTVATTYFFSFSLGFAQTQYLQLVLGYSALKTGMAVVPSALVITVIAPVGVRGFARFGPRVMISLSLAILAMSAVGLGLTGVHAGYPPILLALLCSGAGVGLVAAGTTTMVMSTVEPEKAGMASGAQTATRQLGGALGVAVIGSLIASRYSASLAASLAGTAAAPYTSTAQHSLASALGLQGVAPSIQAFVALAARQAFVDGIHLGAVVLGSFGIAVSIAAFWVLSPRHEGAKLAEEPAQLDFEAAKHHVPVRDGRSEGGA